MATAAKYNKGEILRAIEAPFLKDNLPEFDTGDTVRVDYRVREGNRERIQSFEGVVIVRNNGKTGARSTFTVRKISFGEGVERIFPLHSPLISEIAIVRRGRTRRAKLYYLRNLRGKAARLKTDVGRQEADRAAARVAKEASAKARAEEEAARARDEEAKRQAEAANTQADNLGADASDPAVATNAEVQASEHSED